MNKSKPSLICVVGPTAVGKTAMAIRLAGAFQTEVVSADSRQFYRELEIGTAKPTEEELNTVPHHFINTLSIYDAYDAGLFEQEVLSLLSELFQKYNTVVLVGGSGLFVDAVAYGMDEFPDVPDEIRQVLNKEFNEKGLEPLQDELKEKDPVYYDQVDLKNPQRVIRALEVIRSSDKPFSAFRKAIKKERPFNVIKIGLEMERQALNERIDLRMDQMIDQGLFNEAEEFLESRALNALQTVGYKEIFGYLLGNYDKPKAVELLKRNSRRYAKRQLTWFKRDGTTMWFGPDDFDEVLSYLNEKLKLPEPKD